MKVENKVAGSRVLHKSNCHSRVRKSFTNKFGDIITLFGTHGFEWSVGVQKKKSCCMTITTFPKGRVDALAYYNKVCRA